MQQHFIYHCVLSIVRNLIILCHRYKDLHQWAAINVTELSDLLRWCVDHPTKLKRIGEGAQKVMFTHYTRENVAQDAKNRIIQIKKDIRNRGWNHFLLRNELKSSMRHSEILQNREIAKIERVDKNNEKLTSKLHSLVNAFDDVSKQLDEVSKMMSVFQSMMEKPLQAEEKKEISTEKVNIAKSRTMVDSQFQNKNV